MGQRLKYTFSEMEAPDAESIERPRWHAVAIVAPPTACSAARACADKRYLSVDAPRLPLAACDVEICDCTYRHFADRRQGPRRAEDEPNGPPSLDRERRRSRGRRADD